MTPKSCVSQARGAPVDVKFRDLTFSLNRAGDVSVILVDGQVKYRIALCGNEGALVRAYSAAGDTLAYKIIAQERKT